MVYKNMMLLGYYHDQYCKNCDIRNVNNFARDTCESHILILKWVTKILFIKH